MTTLPPLHLHLLAHPQSAEANQLAAALMRRFVKPPACGGLRIPVFFTRTGATICRRRSTPKTT